MSHPRMNCYVTLSPEQLEFADKLDSSNWKTLSELGVYAFLRNVLKNRGDPRPLSWQKKPGTLTFDSIPINVLPVLDSVHGMPVQYTMMYGKAVYVGVGMEKNPMLTIFGWCWANELLKARNSGTRDIEGKRSLPLDDPALKDFMQLAWRSAELRFPR